MGSIPPSSEARGLLQGAMSTQGMSPHGRPQGLPEGPLTSMMPFVQGIMSVIAITFSGVVLAVILKQKLYRHSQYLLLANLAFSDLIFGLLTCARLLFNVAELTFPRFCNVVSLVGLTSSKISVSCVLIASLNTFVTVRRQQQMNASLSDNMLKCALVVAWGTWLTCSTLTFLPIEQGQFQMKHCFIGNFNRHLLAFICILLIVHFVLMACIQFGTFLMLYMQSKSLQVEVHPDLNNSTIKHRRLTRMSRLSTTVGILFISTVLCWIPFVTLLTIFTFTQVSPPIVKPQYILLSYNLVYINASINTVSYIIRGAEINDVIIKWFPCLRWTKHKKLQVTLVSHSLHSAVTNVQVNPT